MSWSISASGTKETVTTAVNDAATVQGPAMQAQMDLAKELIKTEIEQMHAQFDQVSVSANGSLDDKHRSFNIWIGFSATPVDASTEAGARELANRLKNA